MPDASKPQSVPDKLAYLSMTCANPSDHLSAGLWCETANEAYMLARDLFEQFEVLREFCEAHWAHENGIVDFDLHASQVERLRAAAEAAYRMLHPPDSFPASEPGAS